ncbi:hypothetical protein AAFF_G00398650 [Aldrovandia affinis]|uniref:SNF2 N-terminal domain-containing protein n=1 Tax=Aldrovandia affinis TaxID=143900 RepID=A0AAD7SCL5_9TELE|nr:hypothetical protein AAFF_G00398650 [Aldrovandia affinis]
MSEEAISGSDMEPGLDTEEDDDQEGEEEDNDGDDEEEDADPPQSSPLSTDDESAGGASTEEPLRASSTSPARPSSQPCPTSQPPSSPDSHSPSLSPPSSRKRVFKPSHLRRNIRKLLKEHQLEAVTQAAQQEELERRKRLELQRKEFPAPPLPEWPPGEVVVRAGLVSQAQAGRGEVICLDSSGSEDDAHAPPRPERSDVIELSSDEDGALQISSESANEEEDTPGSEEVGGAHVNDALNQPDALGRVLVNINHPANERDLFLSPQLARAVKPHQIGGIRFLYDNLVESLERYANSSGFGCILAHSMGLGKTMQVISFIDILLRHTGARTVLAIVPVNTLQNWLAEFNMWVPPPESLPPENDPETIAPRTFRVHILSDEQRTTVSRAKVVSEWAAGAVCC